MGVWEKHRQEKVNPQARDGGGAHAQLVLRQANAEAAELFSLHSPLWHKQRSHSLTRGERSNSPRTSSVHHKLNIVCPLWELPGFKNPQVTVLFRLTPSANWISYSETAINVLRSGDMSWGKHGGGSSRIVYSSDGGGHQHRMGTCCGLAEQKMITMQGNWLAIFRLCVESRGDCGCVDGLLSPDRNIQPACPRLNPLNSTRCKLNSTGVDLWLVSLICKWRVYYLSSAPSARTRSILLKQSEMVIGSDTAGWAVRSSVSACSAVCHNPHSPPPSNAVICDHVLHRMPLPIVNYHRGTLIERGEQTTDRLGWVTADQWHIDSSSPDDD